MLLKLSHSFLPFIPLRLVPPPPTLVHVHRSYFHILWLLHFPYYLNLPLSILYLPFMLLIPCTFFPILLPPTPH